MSYRTRVPSPASPWLRHDAHLAHDVPGHPERPARIRALEAEMSAHDWFGCERVEAPRVERELLLAVHPQSHVASIEALCAAGGGAIDADTYVMEGTYEAALRAAGGAAALADALLGEGARSGVSALRPPGHHAEAARAMGFCFFANAAVAARRARDAHGAERVLILDWDVHHGNGTQAMFLNDPSVLFVSIQQWPFWPGTGGPGDGNESTINVPLPAGSGDGEYVQTMEETVEPAIERFAPDLLLISAGFDAGEGDLLGSMRVTPQGFGELATRAGRLCERRALILEGGYNLDTLPGLVRPVVEAL